MKYLIPILINLFVISFLHAQYCENCIPKDWIVTGDGVNFRSDPSTNSNPIGKLNNGEVLIFIEIAPGNHTTNWIMINESWLKVQRVSTSQIGYVFGKYVETLETIDPSYKRIQNGNWYGIYQKGQNVEIKKLVPQLQVNDEGDTSILGNNEMPKVSICSQSEIKEGIMAGRIYPDHQGKLSIGIREELMMTQKYIFSLVCTGEVKLNDFMNFTRINERIYFITEEIDGGQRHYTKQDLTECIHKFGEVGYHLIFAGDLNGDGIPEIIFREASNSESVTYYFMSNKEGKMELKSIAYGVDNC